MPHRVRPAASIFPESNKRIDLLLTISAFVAQHPYYTRATLLFRKDGHRTFLNHKEQLFSFPDLIYIGGGLRQPDLVIQEDLYDELENVPGRRISLGLADQPYWEWLPLMTQLNQLFSDKGDPEVLSLEFFEWTYNPVVIIWFRS